MKRLILILAILIISTAAQAADVTLAWDPSATATVTGYTVHYGPVSGLSDDYEYKVNAGNVTQFTVEGLPPGVWYFAVKAYDAAGNQSPFSNEVNTTLVSAPGLDRPHTPISTPVPPGQLKKL